MTGKIRTRSDKMEERYDDKEGEISLLRKLIEDEPEVSPGELYEILKDYVKFTSSGEIRFRPAARSLRLRDKVLLVLIARKALNMLGMADDEEMTPREISAILGANGGTIRGILTLLKREGLVVSPQRGAWKVDWVSIDDIKMELASRIGKAPKEED